MGGSGIIGRYLRALVQERWGRPVFIFDYTDIPPPTNGRYLLLAVSYSGSTRETLEAFRLFAPKAAGIGVVSGRGELLELASRHRALTVGVGGSPAPRFGFAKMLSATIKLFANLTGENWVLEELAKARLELEALISQSLISEADTLAQNIASSTPIVYSSSHLLPVGYRWKTQFNENAKIHAFHSTLPEANHNEVNARQAREGFKAIMLISKKYPQLVQSSYRAYEQVADTPHVEVWAKGSTNLAEMLYTTIYGDYLTVRLAELLGVDPLRVQAITRVKAIQRTGAGV